MGELAGQPNFFAEKIWQSLMDNKISEYIDYRNYEILFDDKFDRYWDGSRTIFNSKLHTIREDKSNRWKAGNDIHMVINNRTKDRFQFAPVVKCVSVQKIRIKHTQSSRSRPLIYIEIESQKTPGYMLCLDTYNPETKESSFGHIDKLALNDGFPSVEAFFQFFDRSFVGKIVHWTDLKY